MINQPDAQALLAQARKVLLQELLPLLPRERVYDALMMANAMAIAGREAAGGAAAQAQVDEAIAGFYRSIGLPAGSAPARAAGDRAGDAAASTASPEAVLAADIRQGAIAPEHDAALLALLRGITRGKLAISNPKYLAA